MTELPKHLINTPQRAPHCSEEQTHKKPNHTHFKELMLQEKEEEDIDDKECPAPSVLLSSPWCETSKPLSVSALGGSPAPVAAPCCPTEITDLFEKMASTMILMTSSGEQETTLVLEGTRFASSPFFGTRVTIKEFTTAPKVFNIHIAAQSTALHLLAAHTGALMASFESDKFPFSVHRLDTELTTEENSSFSRGNKDKNKNFDRKQDDS